MLKQSFLCAIYTSIHLTQPHTLRDDTIFIHIYSKCRVWRMQCTGVRTYYILIPAWSLSSPCPAARLLHPLCLAPSLPLSFALSLFLSPSFSVEFHAIRRTAHRNLCAAIRAYMEVWTDSVLWPIPCRLVFESILLFVDLPLALVRVWILYYVQNDGTRCRSASRPIISQLLNADIMHSVHAYVCVCVWLR